MHERPTRAGRGARIAGLVLALGSIGALTTATLAGADSDRPHSGARALVEERSCAHDEPASRDGATSDAIALSGDVISVSVRPTAVLELDATGRVVAAMTNTGCAPRAGDDLYISRAGTITPASRAAVPPEGWTGDFTRRGTFQPQSH